MGHKDYGRRGDHGESNRCKNTASRAGGNKEFYKTPLFLFTGAQSLLGEIGI